MAIDLAAAEAALDGSSSPEQPAPERASETSRSGRRSSSCEACRKAKRKCTHQTGVPEVVSASELLAGAEQRGGPSGSSPAGSHSPARRRSAKVPDLQEAEEAILVVLRGLGDILANVWGDPELAIPDAEGRPCASAWARTLDQWGMLGHTRKLAPAEAVSRTAAIAFPRAKRVAMARGQRPAKQGKRPGFRRPPGMEQAQHSGPATSGAAAPAGAPPDSPPPFGENFERPFNPFDPTVS